MTYLVYTLFTIVLTVTLISISYLLSQVQTDSEKVSPYEYLTEVAESGTRSPTVISVLPVLVRGLE